MKEKLLQLYLQQQQTFKNVLRNFPGDDLAGPFLMSPGQLYCNQRNPLLVVGQETSGWTHYIDELEKQMDTYERFNVGKEHGSSIFWDIIRKMEHLLGNDPCSCAWTNMSKFDLYGGKSYGKYSKEIARVDQVLLEEIKIVNPKICLFFTGPDFDSRLKKVFKGIEFIEIPGWGLNQLSLLKHPLLPVYTFRAYHPKSLKLRKLESKFMQTVSDFVRGGISIN